MSETEPDVMRSESSTARRLTRLFRIERRGGFDRRPVAIVRQLIARRGALVEALLMLDLQRRMSATRSSAELDWALAGLSREVDRARDRAAKRLEQIVKDLRLSRGEGLATGIRTSTAGHTLGTS
ncbi:MAG: hypothetical protein WB611_08765 [Stellaceae bacterium]